MSIVVRVHYIVHCDNCGCTFGYFEGTRWLPQAVRQEVTQKYGWTEAGDNHHCPNCPPLCPKCLRQDIECECSDR